ncbi:hypothetical protein AGABI1DRAFT_123799 [Agaricus bisporus var. burnettii JB137-S8]|uniref:Uncharacterized protein n=1 Tax=Agaricus bisporus var. burnettii (strain JB137-S8 / ATCC MYA-4627 / FGSC 10392) TaxID=597362 RepID=K5X6G3_AGABU|nr:uncharacterized protein AGABI1DRAFT_123799 [Agaricus bisporus var. burnettii JB137-S8]EKM83471.1 hypothetical protein AGABI1DRAFT_123799 [Agaricus bisporus var. burnettii JB137-S8]
MPFKLDIFKRGMPLSYPPDLIFKSLIRELEKAYTGFKALSPARGPSRLPLHYWDVVPFVIVKGVMLGARTGIFMPMIDEKRRLWLESESVILRELQASYGSIRNG